MAIHKITCSKCGKEVDFDFYRANKPFVKFMKEKSLCFDCAFWYDVISHPKPGVFAISGSLYYFNPMRGKKLSKWMLKKPNIVFVRDMHTGEVMGCIDYKYYGDIPDRFKSLLPNSFQFISSKTYEKIIEYQGTCCLSKGCFDRYHCFWYNPDIAEPNGPWNKIPSSYCVGNENCVSFINKNTMYNVNPHRHTNPHRSSGV